MYNKQSGSGGSVRYEAKKGHWYHNKQKTTHRKDSPYDGEDGYDAGSYYHNKPMKKSSQESTCRSTEDTSGGKFVVSKKFSRPSETVQYYIEYRGR